MRGGYPIAIVLRIDRKPDDELLGLARLAARFTTHRVRYCAIGGFATAMYLPGRRPNDLDVIIDPTLRSGERAAAAIISLLLDSRAEVGPSFLLPDARSIAAGDQLIIPTAHGTLHVIGAHLPANCERARIIRRRRWYLLGHHAVAVCRLDDLIHIKQAADHGRDALDVAELLAAHPPRRRGSDV